MFREPCLAVTVMARVIHGEYHHKDTKEAGGNFR